MVFLIVLLRLWVTTIYKWECFIFNKLKSENAEVAGSVCPVNVCLEAGFKQYLHFPVVFNKISGTTRVLSFSTVFSKVKW